MKFVIIVKLNYRIQVLRNFYRDPDPDFTELNSKYFKYKYNI